MCVATHWMVCSRRSSLMAALLLSEPESSLCKAGQGRGWIKVLREEGGRGVVPTAVGLASPSDSKVFFWRLLPSRGILGQAVHQGLCHPKTRVQCLPSGLNVHLKPRQGQAHTVQFWTFSCSHVQSHCAQCLRAQRTADAR